MAVGMNILCDSGFAGKVDCNFSLKISIIIYTEEF